MKTDWQTECKDVSHSAWCRHLTTGTILTKGKEKRVTVEDEKQRKVQEKVSRYAAKSTEPNDQTEREIYRDAWRIAEPGASNPVAVAGTLADASAALLHRIGTDGVRRHPALRVMAGQLGFLYGVSLGFNMDDFDTVQAYTDTNPVQPASA